MTNKSNLLSPGLTQVLIVIFLVYLSILFVFNSSFDASVKICSNCTKIKYPKPIRMYEEERVKEKEVEKKEKKEEEKKIDPQSTKVEKKSEKEIMITNDFLKNFEKVMDERRGLLESGCNEMRKRSSSQFNTMTSNFQNVIVMKQKNLVWCPVFKASSSTFLHYLLDIYVGMSQERF